MIEIKTGQKRKKMPKFMDIFEWKEWEDYGVKLFMDCKLLKDVGEFKKGHTFDVINFDDRKLCLEFCNNEEVLMTKKFIMEN